MQVSNYQIVFEEGDITLLSELQRNALLSICAKRGENLTPAALLSEVINANIENSVMIFKREKVGELNTLGEAIVSASADKQAQLAPLIEQAKEILGVQ